MLLISEGENGGLNAKGRWVGLKHVFLFLKHVRVLLCWGSISVNTVGWRKVCIYSMIQMSELLGAEANAHPEVRQ